MCTMYLLLCRYLRHKRSIGEIDDALSTGENNSSKPPKKKRRGQNKHRPSTRIPFSEQLCPTLHIKSGNACHYGDKCHYVHDVEKFLASKPVDIPGLCYMYTRYGLCPAGVACRFSTSHVVGGENVINEDVYRSDRAGSSCNVLDKSLQKCLRKRSVSFVRSAQLLKKLEKGVKGSDVGDRDTSTCSVDPKSTSASKDADINCPSGTACDEQGTTEEVRTSIGSTVSGGHTDSVTDATQVEDSSSIEQTSPDQLASGCVIAPTALDSRGEKATCGPFTDEDTVRLRHPEIKKVHVEVDRVQTFYQILS